jgi:hypothetical protein
VVKRLGDGLMTSFGSASDAVSAAHVVVRASPCTGDPQRSMSPSALALAMGRVRAPTLCPTRLPPRPDRVQPTKCPDRTPVRRRRGCGVRWPTPCSSLSPSLHPLCSTRRVSTRCSRA